uniref:CSON010484 protein n=1 Tax=Culicoides sonorensis TaxID=179676 RepID=A0A336N067_CULSO
MGSKILQRSISLLSQHNTLLKTALTNRCQWKPISTSAINQLFHEKSRKGDFDQRTADKVPKKTHILNGLRELKNEIKMWQEEMKDHLKMDPVLIYRPGEVDVAFRFNNNDALDKWVVSTDSDHNQGFSTAALEKSPAGYGLFHGNVRSEVPKDGRVKRAGYCNMKSMRSRKSFKREVALNWTPYNTLVLKVRGDGRNYLINIHTEGYFDVLWHDIYHYVLYTRGGPHWQTTRIPFSKFFLSSKGRIQDKQYPIALDKVTSLSFSVGAKGDSDGPFSLEIDYVGLEFDPNHVEEFAYEMYRMPKYLVAT